MCPVTSLDLAKECLENDSRSVYSRSAGIRSHHDGANENHSLSDSELSVMLWRSHHSAHPSEVLQKKKLWWRVTLRNVGFPAIPRCCCADVPRGVVQKKRYLLVKVVLVTLVQMPSKSPFEQQMVEAKGSSFKSVLTLYIASAFSMVSIVMVGIIATMPTITNNFNFGMVTTYCIPR